jgi:hypothetical protein
VRNKAFKKWLGDWEMWFKKNFLLNGKPVIEIKGNRFTPKEGKTFIEQVSATTDWKATLHSPARCSLKLRLHQKRRCQQKGKGQGGNDV